MSKNYSNKEIVYKAFSYTWSNEAFLSESQVNYVLKRLWALTSGSAEWTGDVVIRFNSISKIQVEEMLDAKSGGISYIQIADLTPDGFVYDLDSDSMPSLCLSSGDDKIIYKGSGFYPFDLLALFFILLTRWEEWARPVLDEFNRYKETASLAVRQGFHQRPILDEWALILRPWLHENTPAWSPDLPQSLISVSYDIDHLCYYKSWSRVFRGFSRELVYQHSLASACRNAYSGFVARLDQSKDPCVTAIDDLMLFGQSLDIKGTFFLMSANTSDHDDGYDINSTLLSNKIEKLTASGHQLAWHPGYYAAHDEDLFMLEFQRFKKVCADASFGVRYHYLRWQAGKSWYRMEQLGIEYDASLGYSSTCGFRCSTCHAFPAYDLIEDRELRLEIRPFVVMDGYLLRNLLNAESVVEDMLAKCYKVNGCFSVVMHNYTVMAYPGFLDLMRRLLM